MLLVVDVGNTNTVLGVYEISSVGFVKQPRPEPRMKMRRPPVREPEPVHADSPVAE